jgi:hypothetical protein
VACRDPHNELAVVASDSESSRLGDQQRDLGAQVNLVVRLFEATLPDRHESTPAVGSASPANGLAGSAWLGPRRHAREGAQK